MADKVKMERERTATARSSLSDSELSHFSASAVLAWLTAFFKHSSSALNAWSFETTSFPAALSRLLPSAWISTTRSEASEYDWLKASTLVVGSSTERGDEPLDHLTDVGGASR